MVSKDNVLLERRMWTLKASTLFFASKPPWGTNAKKMCYWWDFFCDTQNHFFRKYRFDLWHQRLNQQPSICRTPVKNKMQSHQKGNQKIDQTWNESILPKNSILLKNFVGDIVGKIQAGSFSEICVRKSTRKEKELDLSRSRLFKIPIERTK